MNHFIHRNQGEVYAMKTASTANGVTTTLLDQKGYDPRGRLIREWHTINGGTPVLISSASYDEMERMSSNALGNSIVNMAYTYDIQNRLRKINDPANLGTKPFAMEMQYNSPDVSGATAQFAGNISAVRWKHISGSEQTYYYNYDSYSRMTGGIHGGGNNEQYIGYDSNGNINALTRTGTQATGLSYTYSGNRLTSLTKDGTGYSYAYDNNGNNTTDGLRGMTIAYNYLNLPKTISKSTDQLDYIYSATGEKLAAKLNGTVNNFYTGTIVYKGDKTIDYIQTSTGIVRKVGADFIRQYNISDHLGNTRSIVNQGGTIEQTTDYYPYGLAFSYNNLDKNRYLYNGKELQNQTLATTFFGMYDYGARYYDPVIGRWNSVDPHAENYYSWSPYHYAANNPLIMIDPNGRDWYTSTDGSATMWRKGNEAIEGFKNIGVTYTQNIGRGVSVGYTQNEATSMTFKGIDESNFVSQSTGTGCKIASDQMLANEGVNSNGERINVVNADANGVATTANGNASKGIKAIDKALENGNPIEVGVDSKPVQVNNLKPNGDGMTDHFVVVSSKTETLNKGQVTSKTYNFFDPRNSTFGTSPTNSLQISNNKLVGYFLGGTNKNIPYTVTTVRRSR